MQIFLNNQTYHMDIFSEVLIKAVLANKIDTIRKNFIPSQKRGSMVVEGGIGG